MNQEQKECQNCGAWDTHELEGTVEQAKIQIIRLKIYRRLYLCIYAAFLSVNFHIIFTLLDQHNRPLFSVIDVHLVLGIYLFICFFYSFFSACRIYGHNVAYILLITLLLIFLSIFGVLILMLVDKNIFRYAKKLEYNVSPIEKKIIKKLVNKIIWFVLIGIITIGILIIAVIINYA